jgi:hypothetical protein
MRTTTRSDRTSSEQEKTVQGSRISGCDGRQKALKKISKKFPGNPPRGSKIAPACREKVPDHPPRAPAAGGKMTALIVLSNTSMSTSTPKEVR